MYYIFVIIIIILLRITTIVINFMEINTIDCIISIGVLSFFIVLPE
jgi:hypothetical protein